MSNQKVIVDGVEHSVVETRKFRGSEKSGVADGVYSVVMIEDKNGKKTPKVVVGTRLFTIKNYQKGEDEVILKQREKRVEWPARKNENVSDDVELDGAVIRTMNGLRAMVGEKALNEFLMRVLGDEFIRVEKVQSSMKNLPSDLLEKIATGGADAIAKVRAALGQS